MEQKKKLLEDLAEEGTKKDEEMKKLQQVWVLYLELLLRAYWGCISLPHTHNPRLNMVKEVFGREKNVTMFQMGINLCKSKELHI